MLHAPGARGAGQMLLAAPGRLARAFGLSELVIGLTMLSVLGVTGLVAPEGLRVAPAVSSFDLPVMLAVCFACLPVFWRRHRIARWEGLLFLGYYAAYSFYVVLAATEHDALPHVSAVMLEFVLPLTAVTLAVLIFRALHERGRAARGA
jgi:cation:H+ antiporter